ncbi:hypothetical protein VitviT2T_007049 [Vitis vinifera]|uniref:Integrase catalytic domain-containing protein n=1 Tax=Vitis vinifera TaxID=29760 RepID=A0ABY9BYT9_VITVI|nr:hypothetical protein VitviT2T_007049 [Vitis vinifera]
MSQFPFDLVHCDIWGPYSVSSHARHRYFPTLVDDCSRFTWIFLLKQKSDVGTIIPKFFNMVVTQFNAKIKVFRSDNAPELAFTDFFNDRGVLHQFSRVERPQQKSIVERKHQHLLNVGRALYFQSRFPIQFWSECVLTTTFLINSTPSSLLNHCTPYEILHKSIADYSHFREFGCLAFASTLTAHRTKFQPRSRVCVLGYPPGIKGCRLYDVVTKQIFISQDAIFHEEIFPFHTATPLDKLIGPFPNLVLPISSLEPSPISQSIVYAPSIDSNISLPISGGLSPTLDSAFNNIASELFDSDLHVSAPSLAKVLLRRSIRVSKPPSYLKDFHCNLLSHKDLPSCATSYPLSKHLSHGSLSASVKFPLWRAAMKAELDAMELNKTWSVVSLPKGKHSIGCKWIYKVKYKSDGSIERHKAPIVAKGYTQQVGLDFFETFSPVAKLVTVKVLLALATIQKWHLVQLDVNNAFLNGYLFEEVYMDLPLGYGK